MAIKWTGVEDITDKKSAVVEITGSSGTGRTSLAVTAPGPIAYIGFSEKSREILLKRCQKLEESGKSLKIKMSDLGFAFFGSTAEIKARAHGLLNDFLETYLDAYTWARTVIIDTYQELDVLTRNAEFGGLKPEEKIAPYRVYGDVNFFWTRILNHARQKKEQGINTIWIGGYTQEWKDNKPTGRMIRDSGRVDSMVLKKCDVVIETSKNTIVTTAKDGTKTSDLVFNGTIYKGWQNAFEYEGEGFENEMVTWGNLMGLVTETSSKLWEVGR